MLDPKTAETALKILRRREPFATTVQLSGDRTITVFNVAWGRDMGEEYDHVTTNISPEPDGEHSIDFFHTSEIEVLIDPETGGRLFP